MYRSRSTVRCRVVPSDDEQVMVKRSATCHPTSSPYPQPSNVRHGSYLPVNSTDNNVLDANPVVGPNVVVRVDRSENGAVWSEVQQSTGRQVEWKRRPACSAAGSGHSNGCHGKRSSHCIVCKMGRGRVTPDLLSTLVTLTQPTSPDFQLLQKTSEQREQLLNDETLLTAACTKLDVVSSRSGPSNCVADAETSDGTLPAAPLSLITTLFKPTLTSQTRSDDVIKATRAVAARSTVGRHVTFCVRTTNNGCQCHHTPGGGQLVTDLQLQHFSRFIKPTACRACNVASSNALPGHRPLNGSRGSEQPVGENRVSSTSVARSQSLLHYDPGARELRDTTLQVFAQSQRCAKGRVSSSVSKMGQSVVRHNPRRPQVLTNASAHPFSTDLTKSVGKRRSSAEEKFLHNKLSTQVTSSTLRPSSFLAGRSNVGSTATTASTTTATTTTTNGRPLSTDEYTALVRMVDSLLHHHPLPTLVASPSEEEMLLYRLLAEC